VERRGGCRDGGGRECGIGEIDHRDGLAVVGGVDVGGHPP